MSADCYTFRLDLPGEWADGWLYKEHLILWSRTGEMHVSPLAELDKGVRERVSPALGVVADHLIFRNDWKASDQFRRMTSVPGVEQAFLGDFEHASRELIVSVDEVTPDPVRGERIPGVVLDAAVYANQVYVGSTQGLFETRFDPDRPTHGSAVIERLPDRVSAVTARYAAVNGSAGEAGLWFSRINLDVGRKRTEDGNFRRVAEYSRGNSFATTNLLNYTDEAIPALLRSELSKESSQGDRGDRDSGKLQITGYAAPANIGGVMASALQSRRSAWRDATPEFSASLTDGTAEVLGNSGNRLLVAWQESLRVIDLKFLKDRDVAARRDKDFRDTAGLEIDPVSILDTHEFVNGFLVELPDEVRLINSQGSYSLISEPVARIRTFAHSRRHREVVLLIRETGVSLLGIYITRDEGPE